MTILGSREELKTLPKRMKTSRLLITAAAQPTSAMTRARAGKLFLLTAPLMNISIQYAAPLILHYSNSQDHFTAAQHPDVHR